MNRWLLIAHRGASADATENTLAAFALAAEQGADAVECDVRLTQDGTPVVLHDADLRRLAGRTERVEALTIAELAAVRVGDGQLIPTLAEALDWSRRGLPLVVELKAGPDPSLLAECVAPVIRSAADRIVAVSSFSLSILQRVAERLPDVALALVADEASEVAAARAHAVGASALHLAVGRWPGRPPFQPTLVWTVDDRADATRVLSEGAAGLFTNRPGVLAAVRATV